MARYLVLGTGVGKAIAYHLVVSGGRNTQILLADADYSKLERAGELVSLALSRRGKSLQGSYIQFCLLDVVSGELDAEFLSGFDVVISALPAKFNFEIAKTAVKAGVNFCELGGIIEETRRLTELTVEAQKEGVTLLTGCGFEPGTGDILARILVDRMDETDSVEISAGGLPQKPRPPVYYQRVFSLEGLEHLCYDSIPVLEDGEIRWKEPFSGYDRMMVSELSSFSNGSGRVRGQVEMFNTAGSSLLPWTLKNLGVKNFTEKTVRWPGFVDFVRDVSRGDFVRTIEPYVNVPVAADNPDLAWMKVRASGYINGGRLRPSFTMLDLYDAATGFTAMERVTGFPTAILAKMITEGKTKKGSYTPDCALDVVGRQQFLTELKKHFCISEK